MSVELLESAKKQAAFAAVDEFVTADTKFVGVGSGSTVVYAVERLNEKAKASQKPLHCVPTSFQARQLITAADSLILSDLESCPLLDVCIDGSDECDADLNCIKGGGGCLTQEKIVAYNSKQFVVIADYRKDSTVLGHSWRLGVPIEVIPFAYTAVSNDIKRLGGTPVLRMAKAKAGPLVTDNGMFIIDADWGDIQDPAALHQSLIVIPGVVETGLFCDMAKVAFFGQADGTVVRKTAQ
ncbi:ribose-5-phosphate isomerase [Sphaeroforma arctica JP610]|uniref:ribose-5-phosphate isomerase n=1 Tax=Sphaeroforma arctica JP610 TaxID=667725 RepID=A0A0L0FLI3_9EUKA|nr:ribose-5-phosphate isomerase [Sphaeroforma arctica JP610]KNC77637.1 ribose-5-phosphate isomerase [Sphaeroforma arctica JP610]|eukprot:XP_014151539.1 ribose-5-phosphate isomerase [Sphaeroforma arctica JP610]